MRDVELSALVVPYKASPYLVDELIDWDMKEHIETDRFYKLVVQTMETLSEAYQRYINGAYAAGDTVAIEQAVEIIHESLNRRRPADQKAPHAPNGAVPLSGVASTTNTVGG